MDKSHNLALNPDHASGGRSVTPPYYTPGRRSQQLCVPQGVGGFTSIQGLHFITL
uniref:Uncharacterized protein n=1 Tax=Anguilla anguilla TaxID=7936 RepID=A0A0E9QP51_ANGAN